MYIDSWFSYLADMLAVIASVPILVLSSVSESKFLNLCEDYYYVTFFPQRKAEGSWLRFFRYVEKQVIVDGRLQIKWLWLLFFLPRKVEGRRKDKTVSLILISLTFSFSAIFNLIDLLPFFILSLIANPLHSI